MNGILLTDGLIGGTMLGGEGAVKFKSTSKSVIKDLKIFNYLISPERLKESIENDFIVGYEISKQRILKILKTQLNKASYTKTPPRSKLIVLERRIYNDVQKKYCNIKNITKKPHSLRNYNKLWKEIELSIRDGVIDDEFEYFGVDIVASDNLKKSVMELHKLYKEYSKNVMIIDDNAQLINCLRLTDKARSYYDSIDFD